MKIGTKVTIKSYNNMVGIIEQVYDDGYVLVNLEPSFKPYIDSRSIVKLCVPEDDIGKSDAWTDLWDSAEDT